MIYEFSHYPTDAGRRVRFVVGREELRQVRDAGFLAADWARDLEVIDSAVQAELFVVTTPHAARILVDALAMVGGDAAVAARMLSTALDGMVFELRSGRTVAELIAVSRRDSRRKPARA